MVISLGTPAGSQKIVLMYKAIFLKRNTASFYQIISFLFDFSQPIYAVVHSTCN